MTTNMPESRFLTIPGRAPDGGSLRLHCIDWGGDGPPLLLLHGLSSSARIWDLMAPQLARHFHTIALDQRGHGLSDVPEEGYSFAGVTADVAAAIDALGLDRPLVVGHSWGGNVAVQLAADYPDYVRGIGLVDGGFTQLASAEGMTWEKAEQMMRPPDIDGMEVERFVGFMRQWPDVRDRWSEQLQEMILSNFRIEDGRIYRRLPIPLHMNIVRAIWDQHASEMWPRIACPVLLVPAISREEGQRPGWNERKVTGVEEARARLRNATVVVMKDTIHDVPVQRPGELADAIIEFAQGLN